MSEFYMFLWRH